MARDNTELAFTTGAQWPANPNRREPHNYGPIRFHFERAGGWQSSENRKSCSSILKSKGVWSWAVLVLLLILDGFLIFGPSRPSTFEYGRHPPSWCHLPNGFVTPQRRMPFRPRPPFWTVVKPNLVLPLFRALNGERRWLVDAYKGRELGALTAVGNH